MGSIIFGVILGLLTIVGQFAYVLFYNDSHSYSIDEGRREKKSFNKSFAIVTFIVPVLLFSFLSTFVRVGTGEIAVMTRFGRVTGQEFSEGFHFKNPLDTANKYDVKVQKIETDVAAASKDLQDVNAKVVINYQLEAGKVNEVHQNVGINYQEKVVDPAIQEVFKASSAKFDATQLITDRAGVKAEAYELLKSRLEPYGIFIRDLSITNFGFSREFTKAIEAKQVAQQEAEQAKFNAQRAEQDAQAAINRAKGEAESQRLQQRTLSDEVLQKLFLDKWNGEMPKVVGGEGLLLNVNSLIGQ